MKPTKLLLFTTTCAVSLLIPLIHAEAFPEPVLDWELKLETSLNASPIAYPGQTPNSVVLGSGGRVIRISGSGEVLYDISFGPAGSRGDIYDAGATDLDGDGTEELIVGHNAGFVYAMKAENGEILWEYDLGSPLATWRMATPGDLDGDGLLEVVATDMDGWVTCLDHKGSLRWRSKVEEYRLSTPAIGDINNDGQPEIVYGSATRHIVALDRDGHLLWDSFQPPLQLGRTSSLIADLDEDGNAEVYGMSSMISPNTGLVSLNGVDGSLRWVGETLHKAYGGRNVVKFSNGSLGILACDKANNVSAFQADGTLRWQTQVGGRGIWTAPAVADLDGDGDHEIVVTVRDRPRDGSGTSWYVLSCEGEILGAYAHGSGQFGGALVADIDGDRTLEVVLASQSGEVSAFSFGGVVRDDAVISSSWRGPAYPARKPGVSPQPIPQVPELPPIKSIGGRFGENEMSVKLPDSDGPLAVEVETTDPNGIRQIQLFRAIPGSDRVDVAWPVSVSGEYRVEFRFIDLEENQTLGIQPLITRTEDPMESIEKAKDAAIATIEKEISQVVERVPEMIISLTKSVAEIEARYSILRRRIQVTAATQVAELSDAFQQSKEFLAFLRQSENLLSLASTAAEKGKTPSFALWQDENPWDNKDPLESLPKEAEPLAISAWAFGNEVESVCVNAVNLAPSGLTLRVEAGRVSRDGSSEGLPAVHEFTSLHRAVALPSRYGETVPDVLPPLGEDYLLDIAPGEAKQLWINVDTEDLDPGNYEISWVVRTLDAASATEELFIHLEVSPVSVPEKSRFLANFWSRNKLGDISTVSDLSKHGQTIWYSLRLPSAQVDADGNLVGTLDWEEHDAVVREAEQVELILYNGMPTPKFPEGVEVTDELRLTARRNYAKAMVEHLRTLGLGYENFMFYVEDETGLTGGPEHYLEIARANKEIDPNFQNYANPWGSITIEDIRKMWPVTDVWQPGMETIEYIGPEYVAEMKRGGKRVATYTPPGNARVLRPLGFYRAQAWQAFHWGIEGGGWWVYHSDDLWATNPDREPGYGAVAFDGRSLVPSRRWEANRDGIEDFNILCVLRDLVQETSDEEAKRVLEDAVGYVADTTITGMPREAADYELDFATFMEHRERIRKTLERLQK